MSEKDPSRRIEIDGDILITDEEFCRVALDDATRRTAQRLDRQGLPYVKIAGKKFRPLNAGRAWLTARIVSKTHEERTPRRHEPLRRRRGGR
jgi:hypothetical protein